ncbi:MAG: hypothetical protein AAFN10_18085 [Bacteroidota bacterium]
MKSQIIFSLAFFVFLFSFSSSLKAQKSTNGLVDSLLLFKAPLQLESGGKVLIGYSEMDFVLKTKSSMKRIPAAYAKKLAVPGNTQMATEPIIIQPFSRKVNDACFRFTCSTSCDDCQLLWFDRNGDGKIQPASEVRCVNSKGKLRLLRAERIECE